MVCWHMLRDLYRRNEKLGYRVDKQMAAPILSVFPALGLIVRPELKISTKSRKCNARNSLSRCSNSTKIVVRWGFAPDPTGGAYSAPPDPIAGFKGPYS